VVDYLYRVEGSAALLGRDPKRYFELAAADAAAAPGPLDTSLAGQRVSTPLLPSAPVGHDDDQAHGLVRLICEDIANIPSDYDATALINVLSTIDTLPVGYRTELGQFLLATLRSAADTAPDGVSWRFRIINRGLDLPLLGFGVCSRFDATVRAAFQWWVLLRHHERAPAGQLDRLDQALTVGVLLTPRSDGVRDWDTTDSGKRRPAANRGGTDVQPCTLEPLCRAGMTHCTCSASRVSRSTSAGRPRQALIHSRGLSASTRTGQVESPDPADRQRENLPTDSSRRTRRRG
jgi:hypothetical protein